MVGGMPLVSSILTPKRIQHIDAFSKGKKKEHNVAEFLWEMFHARHLFVQLAILNCCFPINN